MRPAIKVVEIHCATVGNLRENCESKLAVRQGFEPWIQVLARITV